MKICSGEKSCIMHVRQKHNNPLQHQFSFDEQGILELFIVYSLAYTLLLPVQVYALTVQRHSLPMLLTSCLAAEYCGVFFSLVHYAKFSVDGDGVRALRLAGSFIDTTAQVHTHSLLWSPYVIGQTIIFSSCFFFLFFPRLISAVGDWMFTILWRMVWA